MAHLHSVYDGDTHFKIDAFTRAITNTTDKSHVVQFDHNSERFTFELPRYIDGHDMSLCNDVAVHYINIGTGGAQNKDVYPVDDFAISPDDETVVICSWLISANATQLAGSLNFLIRFACVADDGTIEYAWHTDIHTGIAVKDGMNNGEAVVAEYADVLEAWKAEIMADFSIDFEAATEAAKAEIEAKGVEVLASIPVDYTELQETVDTLQTEVENIETDLGDSVKYESLSGYYRISQSGGIVHQSSDSFSSWKVPVVGNDGKTIKIATHNISVTPVLVVDEKLNILASQYGTSGNPNLLSEYELTLADGAYYVFVPCYTGYECTITGLDVKGNITTLHRLLTTATEAVTNMQGNVEDTANMVAFITEDTANLLNPLTAVNGYLTTAGNVIVTDSFFTSDFISASEGETIRTRIRNGDILCYALCFYNSEKAFLSMATNIASVVAPENSAFVRVTFNSYLSMAGLFMVYKGEAVKEYVTYKAIKKAVLPVEESPYPDVEIILPRKLVVANGVSVSINHQSVVKNWDVKRAVSANIQNHLYPTYEHKSVITGGVTADGAIGFLFTPDYNIGLLQKRMSVVNVPADAGSDLTKKVLFIGDSKTDANEYTQYLLDMFANDCMSIELLGTRGNSEQNRHEGRSGWSAKGYVTNEWERGVVGESPFFNPETEQFDFSYYMTQNGYTGVDYVFINLGTNDAVSDFIDYYHQMIDGIRAYDPNIIIGLWVPAPFATFGGYTHIGNDNQTFAAMKAVLEEFDTPEYEADKVFVVPTHMNIDTFHDFPWNEVAYNDKTGDKYRVCTDQIHESNGYKHDADVIFGYIKYFATL